MLNAKYFIMPLQGGATTPVLNPHAMGAAWMVSEVKYVDNANEEIDVLHTIEMLIVHDLVEVDAGDTYAYDAKGNETKAAREQAAADRIYGLLPEDQGKRLRALWDEFEASETPEAKFAHVMDNIQPMMLNAANDGKDWKSHEVQLAQILKRNEITPEGSQTLWDYARENFIQPHIEKGNILE